jgi:uncharacterized protein YjdB
MNMKKYILQIITLLFLFATTFISCNKDVHVTGVNLNTETLSLGVGKSEMLTATVLPEKATNKQVVYSSSNILVATVMPNGLVTGISEGTAIIVVSTVDGGFTASCTVKVDGTIGYVPVEKVTLNKKSLSLGTGETELLIATVEPAEATLKEVIWTISNSQIATVVNGTVTALTEGRANIIVTTVDGTKSDTCALEVYKKIYVTGVELNKTELKLAAGDTITLKAKVLPTNASNKNVTWKSSNAAVASVNENGFITAKSDGDAIITVTTEESSYTADCEVKCVTVTSPALTTLEATNINYASATLGGNITNAGNPQYTERGICYSSTVSVPVIDQGGCEKVVVSGTGTGNYTTTVNNLKDRTKYYARAYVKNEFGVIYGNVVTFTTEKGVTLVRFKKSRAHDNITRLAVFDDDEYNTMLALYNFGTGTGTSNYYEIPHGLHRPEYYWTEPGYGGWEPFPGDYELYNFQLGRKYTVTYDYFLHVTDDGPAKSTNFEVPKKENTTVIKIPKDGNTPAEKPKAIISK